MLSSLLDGHARTSTELAVVAEVSPSTASVHLSRLKTENLIKVLVQGKHRYYSLQGAEVASALEALSVWRAIRALASCPTHPTICAPRAPATTTSPEHWESRSTTA